MLALWVGPVASGPGADAEAGAAPPGAACCICASESCSVTSPPSPPPATPHSSMAPGTCSGMGQDQEPPAQSRQDGQCLVFHTVDRGYIDFCASGFGLIRRLFIQLKVLKCMEVRIQCIQLHLLA